MTDPLSSPSLDFSLRTTNGPSRFVAMEVLVNADGPADQLERLVVIADRECIMMNTLCGRLEVRIRITNRLTVPLQ
jgi:hypothetical protein